MTSSHAIRIKIKPRLHVVIDLLKSSNNDALPPPPSTMKPSSTRPCLSLVLHSPSQPRSLHSLCSMYILFKIIPMYCIVSIEACKYA